MQQSSESREYALSTVRETTVQNFLGNIMAERDGYYGVATDISRTMLAKTLGPGCYIDQIFGQTWARWVGLGQLFDREKQLSPLRAIARQNLGRIFLLLVGRSLLR